MGPVKETMGGIQGKLTMEAKSLGRTLWVYILAEFVRRKCVGAGVR
jgi:hypothetical protein